MSIAGPFFKKKKKYFHGKGLVDMDKPKRIGSKKIRPRKTWPSSCNAVIPVH